MYNRRNFIKLTGLATVGGLVLGGNINIFGQVREYFPIPSEVYSDKINLFNQQTFEPLINSTFTIDGDANQVSMRLVEIIGKDEKKGRANQFATDEFLLIFEVDGKDSLGDKIHQISHPELGEFSMFISTVGRSGKRYQAIINRIYL
jgi:hypothetical protein